MSHDPRAFALSVRDDRLPVAPTPPRAVAALSASSLRARSLPQEDEGPSEAAAFSARCAAEVHLRLVQLTGVGRWFGAHSAYAALTPAARSDWRRVRVRPGSAARPPVRMSQLSWCMRHVGVVHREAGELERFRRLLAAVEGEQLRPEALPRGLTQQGWTELPLGPGPGLRALDALPAFYVGWEASGTLFVGARARTWTIDETRDPDDPAVVRRGDLEAHPAATLLLPPFADRAG